MKVTGTPWLHQKIAARVAFISFAWGVLRGVYFREFNPFYTTEYENLVLSGKVEANGTVKDFFLVSGVHDKDFPWGDGEIFWDVLLLIGDPAGGYKKYAITDRILNGLKLSVEKGTYRYEGPLFELVDSHETSFSEMKGKKRNLLQCEAALSIDFTARPHDTTPFPFPTANQVVAKMASDLKQALQNILPSEKMLGIFISPHTVTITAGALEITRKGHEGATYRVIPEKTFGEAERTTFNNIKEPTLLYGYICAIRPDEKAARVQIHSNSLRNDRQRMVKDQLDAFLGAVISRVASKELLMEGGRLSIRDLGPGGEDEGNRPPLLVKVGEPLLEVNNDHFPTAVFQRRVISVKDPSGSVCFALEEDMNLMRLEAENSTREVTVASIRNPNKTEALDSVLQETDFLTLVEKRWRESGKTKQDDFSIVIKPNFMFAYNKRDHTTYTDPGLVLHLVGMLNRAGFRNIAVVEAQSTYGEYFTRRSVREVAEYLGYSGENHTFRLVDLTTDEAEKLYLGPNLGHHPVPLTWKNADFRISFAKNKTHSYAYYTLTLKNIYGALPLADKFSEYHTGRDIYKTTIEYLQAFPVHYGIIDAHSSADGPFGIFADSEPNLTHTIIGGEDLVAVDWVGASKMGLDPKISQYMELAVKAFGKPAIKLVGDANVYRPWLNVPAALSLFAHFGIDANDTFGNLLYMSAAYMDDSYFTHRQEKKSLFIKGARAALKPIQEAVFLQAGGERTAANRIVGKFITWLGSH